MTAIIDSVALDRHGRVAVLTVANPPSNTLSHIVRKGLGDGVVAAAGDGSVSAIVITGAAGVGCGRSAGVLASSLERDVLSSRSAHGDAAKPDAA